CRNARRFLRGPLAAQLGREPGRLDGRDDARGVHLGRVVADAQSPIEIVGSNVAHALDTSQRPFDQGQLLGAIESRYFERGGLVQRLHETWAAPTWRLRAKTE